MMWKMMVKANCSREIRRGSRSIRSFLGRASVNRPPSLRSFGGCCRWMLHGVGEVALRKLLFEPEIVVLLGPVDIDLPSPHGFERALHSNCADIDVSKDQGDEENGDDAVHDLGDLHPGDIGDVEAEQQKIARYGNPSPGPTPPPE